MSDSTLAAGLDDEAVSSEYRVKLTVRNNLILSAIEAAGFKGWGSITRFAKEAGINPSQLAALINFRRPPITLDGEFSTEAKALMEALGAAPSDLWTDVQLNMRMRANSSELFIDEQALEQMLEDHASRRIQVDPEQAAERRNVMGLVDEALATLTKRQAQVLRLRFGLGSDEMTLEQSGCVLDLTRERVRQIEMAAIRKLKDKAMAALVPAAFAASDNVMSPDAADIEKSLMKENAPEP